MENIYDKAIKEIIEPALLPLAEVMLGIQLEKTKEVKDKIQLTLEREGDHLKVLVYKDTSLNRTLHLEFHVSDEDIGKLMLLKKGMLVVRLGLPVLQFVLFMGDRKKPRYLRASYKDEFTSHRFRVISLKSVPYEKLLAYGIPEVVSLAVLCDFGTKSPAEAIKEILNRLDQLTGGKTGASAHITRLEIFSNLRNLQPLLIKISSNMAFTYDLEKDLRYQQGKEKGVEIGIEKGVDIGIEKGIEKGLVKGLQKGVEEEKTFAIRNMLKQNFAIATISGILETSEAEVLLVQKWMEQEAEIVKLLKAKKLNDTLLAKKTGVSAAFVAVIKRTLANSKKKKG